LRCGYTKEGESFVQGRRRRPAAVRLTLPRCTLQQGYRTSYPVQYKSFNVRSSPSFAGSKTPNHRLFSSVRLSQEGWIVVRWNPLFRRLYWRAARYGIWNPQSTVRIHLNSSSSSVLVVARLRVTTRWSYGVHFDTKRSWGLISAPTTTRWHDQAAATLLYVALWLKHCCSKISTTSK